MTEQIGLQAVMDMSDFQKGMSQYMGGLDKMNSSTGSFARAATAHFQSFGKSVLGATAIMGGALAAAAGAAGLAVGKFTVDGIKAAADLESQLSSIAATLGLTKEAAQPLKDTITNLAIDPTLVVTAEEAAEAVEALAKNGLNMQQIIDGTAKSVVLLANATGADFGPAADAVTDIMAQFNKDAGDTTEIINGIVGVTNASKLSFDDYRLAIGQAGGVAASMGVDLDDFNTALAATAPLFNGGSDAGTGFKSFLNSLIPTTKEQKKAFKELGLEFYDNSGQMKDMSVIAEELNDKLFQEVTFTQQVSNMTAEDAAKKKILEQAIARTNRELYKYEVGLNGVAQSEADKAVSVDRLKREHDAAIIAYQGLASAQGTTITTTRQLTQEERNQFLELAFGVDGSRAAIALAESGAVAYTDQAKAAKELGVSYEELNKYIEGGITGFEAYEIAVKKADAVEQARIRTDNFKGALGALGSQIEGVQLLIGDNFLPMLTELTRWFSDLVTQYSPAVIAAFKGFAEQLNALAQYLILVVTDGDLMNDWLTHMSPALQAVVLGTIEWVSWIQQTVAAIQAFLEPITTAIASFVSWQDVLVTLGLAVASVVLPAIWGMITALTPVIAVVGGVLLAVAALRNAWESDWLGIRTKTTAAIGYITGALEPFTGAISQHMGGALAEVKNWATGNETEFTHVKAIWDGAKTSGMTMFNDLKTYLTTNLPIWTATLTEWGNAAANWITAAIPVVTQKLTEWYTALTTYLSANLPIWIANLAAWGYAAWNWIVTASTEAAAKIGEWYTALSTYITTNLPAWQAQLEQWARSAWQWIADAVPVAAQKLAEWGSALIRFLFTWHPILNGQFVKFEIALWSWILSAVPTVVAKLAEWGSAILGYITQNLPAWKQKLSEWATAAWAWIVQASAPAVAKLGEWWDAIKEYVAQQLPAWRQQLAQWGLTAWNWIVQASGQVAAKLALWWAALQNYIAQQLPTWKAELAKWAEAAWQWIVEASKQVGSKLIEWFNALTKWVTDNRPKWRTKMLEFAAALVEWVGDKSADALPELGKWLGKILAWIPLGALSLARKAIELGKALVGWIAGSGGIGGGETAVAQVDPAMEKFKTALSTAIGKVWEGIKSAVQNMLTSWRDEMTKHVDWKKVGSDMLTSVRDGASSMATDIQNKMKELLESAKKKVLDIDWKQLGKDIVQGIIDGITSLGSTVADKIASLFNDAVQKAKEALGISSPSKVFMEIGRDTVLGYVEGFQKTWDKYRRNIYENLPGLGPLKYSELPVGLQKITSLLSAVNGATKKFVELSGNVRAGIMIKDTEKTTDYLSAQLELLNQIESLGIDPRRIMGDTKLGLNASANDLAMIAAKIGNMARNRFAEDLMQRQSAVLAKFVLTPFTNWLSEQTVTLQTALESAVSEFGQMRVDKLLKKVKELDDSIATYTSLQTPLDAGAQFRLAELLTKRANLITQIQSVGDIENGLFGIPDSKNKIDLIKKQIDLLSQAKQLGVDIPREAFANMADDSTLRALTTVLANIQHTQLWQLERQLSELQNPSIDPAAERLKTLEAQQASLDAQLEVLQRIRTLGLQTSGEYSFGLGMAPQELRSLSIQAATVQLQRTQNELRLLERLSPELLNPTATSTGAQLFKAQVLDPMLKTLRETVMLEEDRVRLIERYRQEAAKLASIEMKEKQLAFLRQQNDMLNMIDDEFPGYIAAQIIAGTRFGLDANIDDLLAVAERMTQALIQKVKEDMGIASPSKVFMKIGQNVMDGFGRGIQSMAAQPIASIRQALQPLPYAMSGRALTMNMGGVTINNGMDDVMFEARVRQVVEGMI